MENFWSWNTKSLLSPDAEQSNALYPVPSLRASKQWEKSLPPSPRTWPSWALMILQGCHCLVHLPPPVHPLLLTLHQSSPHSHLRPLTDHIWSCVHYGCGHCFSQNPGCDPGIQGQETRKNHEVTAGNRGCYVFPMCSLVQVMICGVWLGTSPPPLRWTHSEPKELLIMCSKGSVTAFSCVLGHPGSLALGTFSWAFLARNLPDTFSEAKFLTFSMLVLLSVWVTFLPIYHSTKGKVMVAVEIISILASSAGLLGCIFAPKCYIVLIRTDKNSLKSLKNKLSSKGNKHF